MVMNLTPFGDAYEDDNNVLDQIFVMSPDHGFDNKINFDEYQDCEKETPIVNGKKIDLLDGVDVANDTLDGSDVVHCAFDLHMVGYVPFLERIQWRDQP